jgi:hypothetical protein
MRPPAHMRILVPLASLHALFIVAAGYSAMAAAASPSQHAIVIGFVGGFVRHDDLRHPEVQLARRLRSTYKDAVDVEIFENRHRRKAHRAISHFLDRDRCAADSLFIRSTALAPWSVESPTPRLTAVREHIENYGPIMVH